MGPNVWLRFFPVRASAQDFVCPVFVPGDGAREASGFIIERSCNLFE